ncbi:MAG TPA: ThuA domain-containing protein [Chthonomonadaceae bacterium]|nr:ThuA domain-containing protein [Chthonomonadaceae bacterium]
MQRISILFALAALVASIGGARAESKLPVMLLTGQNNHKWELTTPVVERELGQSGRFQVTIVRTPPKGAPATEWRSFHPDFERYRAIFVNYNGEDWPVEAQRALERYMAGGGGLVIYHASNNPFPKWTEWHKMVGLCWQGPAFGDRIAVTDAGRVVRTPKGEGPGAGHGAQHPFEMVNRAPDHPIMRGMPAKWQHGTDELYHGQRGPAVHMDILATAYSDPATRGTGANEPLVYTVVYGRGRVFVCLLGHDVAPTSNADVRTLLTRGTEWAATGAVTLPIAPGFGQPAER